MTEILSLFSLNYFALFVVIAVGYLVGRVKIKGISLDVSAVIFVALLFGHLGVELPKIIQEIGLVLFIFTIGLQAGPGFFDALKKHGVQISIMAMSLIFMAGITAVVCCYLFDIEIPIAAGLLAGALTSTPGLASATDQFGHMSSVGYGIAYPFGVIGVILFLRLLPKLTKSNVQKAEKDWESQAYADYPVLNAQHFIVTNKNADNKTLHQLRFRTMTGAVISRVMHGEKAITPSSETVLHLGDLARVVGSEEALEKASILLGERTDQEMPLSQQYDVQGVLVTNKKVVNKTLSELNLQASFDATVTRIRRSGIDITPTPRSRIRFGDKLIIASSKESMQQIARLFGNDDKRLSDTDFLPIALGISLGVIVGHYTFLGLTGGVLLVALLLSKIGKTGNILWTMSSSANLLLREIGLIFFLTVVGTSAGATLADTFEAKGYSLFLAGAIITTVPMILMTLMAKYIYKSNLLTLLGGLAGSMTSTPGLAAVSGMTQSNAPQVAYATAYPIAMVLLVLVVKLMALLPF